MTWIYAYDWDTTDQSSEYHPERLQDFGLTFWTQLKFIGFAIAQYILITIFSSFY